MVKSELISILMGPIPGTTLWNNPDAPRQFLALKEVQQSPEHHPEGNLHFPLVIDNMALLLEQWDGEDLSDTDKLTLLLAALGHDLGKAVSTFWHEKKQKFVSYNHEVTGVPLTQQLLNDFNLEEYSPKISALVLCHMSHCVSSWTEKSVKKLLLKLAPASMKELVLLMTSDCASRPPLDPNLPKSITEGLLPIYNKITLDVV